MLKKTYSCSGQIPREPWCRSGCLGLSLPNGNSMADKVLKLQLVLEDPYEYPAVWFLAAAWLSIWEIMIVGKRPELYKVRADLEAKVSLLRETRRHSESAEVISIMLSNL